MNHRFFSILTLIGIVAFSNSCVSFKNVHGSGTVFNSRTHEPVTDVTVEMECRRWRFLGEGSRIVKEVLLSTDKQGIYHYDFRHTWNCDFLFLYPKKEGYVDTASIDVRYQYTKYEAVPDRLFLTPMNDSVMQTLEYEYKMTNGKFSSPAYEYSSVYEAFWKSKQIAKTPVEQAFIKEKYCRRMIGLYQELTSSDKEYLEKLTVIGPVKNGRIDHMHEVEKFCEDNNK